MERWRYIALLFVLVLAIGACGKTTSEPPRPTTSPKVSDLPAIDGSAVLEHIRVLASDQFEGRAPGGKGEELTVNYLSEQFKKLGLKPGLPEGSSVQKVPLVGITANPDMTLTFRKGERKRTLKYQDDFIAVTRRVADSASLTNSDMIFVGYGVVAPEFAWDDYKGVDLTGKTLVMLVNDPPVPDPADPARLDPNVFGGRAMTYYGRWTYKYEIGAQKGAAGVLIVHETGPAGYPFDVVRNSWSGEQFTLVRPDNNMNRTAVEGWITLDQAKQLFVLAGQNFDALRALAATRDFKPVPLGTTASISIRNTLRRIESRNVIARLEGGDPRLKHEYVIYAAHWDHLGIGPDVNGDKIYNGAIDNASGTAALVEMARAFTQVSPPPRRSILFLAVTAEEQGLLGSEYYATNPIYPLARTLAAINMDGLNVHGRTKDMTVVGYGLSDLDDYVRQAAAEQGRDVRPDPEPEKGFFYRSDHFNFAKLGVPALDPQKDRTEFIGKPPEYGKKLADDYTERDYHKPSDEVKPDWDMSGATEDLRLLLAVGYRVAQAETYPSWKPGTEFKALRDAQLKAAPPLR